MSDSFKPGAPDNELRRWWFATRNSLKGYRAVWREEAAFRSELIVLLLLIAPAWWLAESWLVFSLLLGVWILVIAGELVNSAIEAAIDRIGPEIHSLSGKAKDAGSALVLTLMVLAGLVWLGVAADRFL
ncbi:diacylglycerol kinase [Wenzhouxiangella marina]|uniref:Diacylglycerol kinase n=1 Tax=Wenzhouxiangella marina TaxID=1579979 RepID=A0A0K0XUP2_9GAMM|nr:diacylglycerol kinase [Wenzhouxiangella marina]AKS41342.1 diacylglycerol kinase [Wenzhouxiangella marina]MBB6086908.1 diacylglycerol kinase (ATP) [Wenzhouxiangella marina]